MSAEQWLFSLHQLSKSPSIQDGISAAEEACQKAWACIYIRRIGRDLKLTTETVATAKYFLHRFYTRNSLQDTNPYELAAASLFLSCKLTDTYRKLRAFILATVRIIARQNIAENSKEFRKWGQAITRAEEALAQSLCFNFAVVLPHFYAVRLVDDIAGSDTLKRLVFELCDEACCTSIILHQTPLVIAALALYVASLSIPNVLIDPATGLSGVACLQTLDPSLEHLNDDVVADLSRELRFNMEGPNGLKEERVSMAFSKLADERVSRTSFDPVA